MECVLSFLLLLLRPSSGTSSGGMSKVDGLSGRPFRECVGVCSSFPVLRNSRDVSLGENTCCSNGVRCTSAILGPSEGLGGESLGLRRASCGCESPGEPKEKPKSTSLILRVL
jgi:hypothetical protein